MEFSRSMGLRSIQYKEDAGYAIAGKDASPSGELGAQNICLGRGRCRIRFGFGASVWRS